jgi:hypothetical protein
MRFNGTLACCSSCDSHLLPGMRECPNCGAPAPRPGGAVHRTAASVALGLAVAVVAPAGLASCGDDTGDDSGIGGAYGAGGTPDVGGAGGDDNNVGGAYGLPAGSDPGGGAPEGGAGGAPAGGAPLGGAGGAGGAADDDA